MPESDTPRDFETQGTWGGAVFHIGACIKYCAYLPWGLERGRGGRKKYANPVACAGKKIYIKIFPPGTTSF